MTREEAIKRLKEARTTIQPFQYVDKSIDYAIKALEQEPCEDCISREAVEKITWEDSSYSDALNVLTEVRDKIRALPSIQPKPNTGHWIERRNRATGHIETVCSECGAEEGHPYNDYCGNCGAKMESEG